MWYSDGNCIEFSPVLREVFLLLVGGQYSSVCNFETLNLVRLAWNGARPLFTPCHMLNAVKQNLLYQPLPSPVFFVES